MFSRRNKKNIYLICLSRPMVPFYHIATGVILELSEREKFCDNFRISGRSFGQKFGFTYTFYTFSLLPGLKIGRSQPA